MELIVIIRMLCICLSLLLTPAFASASLLNDHLQSSRDLGGHDQQFTLRNILPRKLKVPNQVATVEEEGAHYQALNKQMEVLSGKSHSKEAQVMTHQEWIQGSDSDMASQFFDRDYSHVRRRRPIHNKSLPVAP